jgi:hypothetical protein
LFVENSGCAKENPSVPEPILPKIKSLLATPEPPGLGPGPRAGIRSESELEDSLEQIFARSPLPSETRELVRALVLLWHDHLDAAHTISQNIENRDGSLVHAIMHRREPDYGNAKYWFRRVGNHTCFPELGQRATELLESEKESELRPKLLANGSWDPFAFVDACERAARKTDSDKQSRLLRNLQQIETEVLLNHLMQS